MFHISKGPLSYAMICDKQGGHVGDGKSDGQGIFKKPSLEEERSLAHICIKDKIIRIKYSWEIGRKKWSFSPPTHFHQILRWISSNANFRGALWKYRA